MAKKGRPKKKWLKEYHDEILFKCVQAVNFFVNNSSAIIFNFLFELLVV